MTFEIALVLIILLVALILFVSEILPMDLVALLVLSTLAISGLLSPSDALAGFSNAAVVTVWAMFILSEGLTRTGVAHILGRQVLRMAGNTESRIILVIMLSSGILSAFMNNIGVAALMLPVVVDIARKTGRSPSRLLMPLAFGSLLGGLTTLIGTPPNLLVSSALKKAGYAPFELFDFIPVGLTVFLSGVIFVILVGRYFLPKSTLEEDDNKKLERLPELYNLKERRFIMQVRSGSQLASKTLAESKLGSALGLYVAALFRGSDVEVAPGPGLRLQDKDRLLVQGRQEQLNELQRWCDLSIENDSASLKHLISDKIELRAFKLKDDSLLLAKNIKDIDFRNNYGLNILAIRRGELLIRTNLSQQSLKVGDLVLIQGEKEQLKNFKNENINDEFIVVSEKDLKEVFKLQERLFSLKIPIESILSGMTLAESRLGHAFGLRVLGIMRKEELLLMPSSELKLEASDNLIIEGKKEDFEIMQGLQDLEILDEEDLDLELADSGDNGMVEASLAPRSSLAGSSVSQLRFRDRYGVQLLAVWRKGQVFRSNLRDFVLQFGDALLLAGPYKQLSVLKTDSDFILLRMDIGDVPDCRKASWAFIIMLVTLVPVITGHVHISIAAVAGASAMVLFKCLSMSQAYRAIEWRSIFLIAGMLPLGTAMQETGAASYLAEAFLEYTQNFGVWGIIAGLYLITALATTIIPTSALVVLMAPIVLKTCSELGVSAQAGMMAIAIAASASFTSPIAHPANILVMGPGGYRFIDFIKLGVPLALFVMFTTMLTLPLFWPLHP